MSEDGYLSKRFMYLVVDRYLIAFLKVLNSFLNRKKYSRS